MKALLTILILGASTLGASAHPTKPYWHYDIDGYWVYGVGPRGHHHHGYKPRRHTNNDAEIDKGALGILLLFGGLLLLGDETNNQQLNKGK